MWRPLLKVAPSCRNADGIVLVSAEYNATLPPALTNLLDHFPPASYRHKPCSLVTYSMGNFGGCRAHVALLPFVNELGMVNRRNIATSPWNLVIVLLSRCASPPPSVFPWWTRLTWMMRATPRTRRSSST